MRTPLLASLLLVGASIGCASAQNAEQQSADQPQDTSQQAQFFLEFNLPAEAEFVPGELIVKLRPGAAAIAGEALQEIGIERTDRQLSGGDAIYRIPPAALSTATAQQARDQTLAVAEAMSQRPDVEYAHPNYILRILDTTPNDPRYGEQWHYFNNGTGAGQSPGGVSLPAAWDTSTGDANIVVSILDTGILPNHPDIAGSPNYIGGYDMISSASTGNDGDGRDPDPTDPGDACGGQPNSWHGTHVAGTVGVGNTNNGVGVAGINWNVSVQAVRVLGVCGGTLADINDGIRWAAGLSVPGVPTNTTPARVMNMSLGGRGACSTVPALQSAINDAVNAGSAVVVAAGNEASDASGFLPASCNNVITVAASDARGHLVSRYSNYGATIEIMAPGGDRNRDDNGDGNPDGVLSMVSGGYAYYNGTSMASPHVAGVAALLLARNPSWTPAQLLSELQSRALPRNSTQCPRPCGAGLLSAVGGGGPPPQPGLSITLLLGDDELSNGQTTSATATVRRDGAPEQGITVNFSSSNTG
ncbi:MAG: S8 family serine peptidase, partial [Gemmatimonadota bacterium]